MASPHLDFGCDAVLHLFPVGQLDIYHKAVVRVHRQLQGRAGAG